MTGAAKRRENVRMLGIVHMFSCGIGDRARKRFVRGLEIGVSIVFAGCMLTLGE